MERTWILHPFYRDEPVLGRKNRSLSEKRKIRAQTELSAEQYPKIMIQYFFTNFDSDSLLQYKGDSSWPMCTQGHLDLQPNLLPAFGAPDRWCPRDRRGLWGHPACRYSAWPSMTRTCLIQYVQLLWTLCKTSLNTCCSFWNLCCRLLLTLSFSGAICFRLPKINSNLLTNNSPLTYIRENFFETLPVLVCSSPHYLGTFPILPAELGFGKHCQSAGKAH